MKMTIHTKDYVFYLDSECPDLGPIHAQMIEDFKDNRKLEYFENLLEDNTSTAFVIYNNL